MKLFADILFLVFPIMAGGLLSLFVRRDQRSFLPLILSFSGAFILGLALLHLLPEIYSVPGEQIGIWIIAGFLLQMVLNFVSEGVEHGHVHRHEHHHSLIPWTILIGLGTHELLEGIPLQSLGQGNDLESYTLGFHLFKAVIMHKFPVGFALGTMFLLFGFPFRRVLVFLFVFSLMTPIGMILGKLVHFPESVLHVLTAVITGSLFHVSTTILFEMDDSSHRKFSYQKFAAVVAGILLSVITG